MKLSSKFLITSGVLFGVFVLFTILIKTVDVKSIGPNDSSVGFATINDAVFNMFGVNGWAKVLSEIIGYFSLLLGVCFIGVLIYQCIKRKSIKKADKGLYVLCIFYILVGIVYLLFKSLITINYRPVLVDGELVSSFPSSHTILFCSLLISSIFYLSYFVKNKTLKTVITWLLIFLTVFGVVCRLVSGVHWLTDILGGIIMSGVLVSFLLGGKLWIEENEAKEVIEENEKQKTQNNI